MSLFCHSNIYYLNKKSRLFLTFPACFWIPIFFSNFNYDCSNLLGMINLQEQVKKAFCYQQLFWPFSVWINCSSDREKLLKFEAFSLEFSEFLRSLEQFIQTVVTECFFNLFLEIYQISKNRTIIIQIGKNYWDLEICRKS